MYLDFKISSLPPFTSSDENFSLISSINRTAFLSVPIEDGVAEKFQRFLEFVSLWRHNERKKFIVKTWVLQQCLNVFLYSVNWLRFFSQEIRSKSRCYFSMTVPLSWASRSDTFLRDEHNRFPVRGGALGEDGLVLGKVPDGRHKERVGRLRLYHLFHKIISIIGRERKREREREVK